MKLEERVAEAANDKKLKNDLIGEYQNFILAAASKVLKRSVMTSDDEYIIAMMAFGDAIDDYNENKGNFLGFAKTVIRNRIIDSIRREANIIQCRFLRWKKKIQTVKRLNLKYIPLIKAI